MSETYSPPFVSYGTNADGFYPLNSGVNIVSPGFFDTKLGAAPDVKNEAFRMAVMGRQGDVKEIKGLFLYLASDASSYQTGSDNIIDGGYTLP